MNTCKEVVDLLIDYAEDRLSPPQKAALHAHLRDCAPCVDFLESYKATPGILRRALETAMPPDVGARLRAFLDDARS